MKQPLSMEMIKRTTITLILVMAIGGVFSGFSGADEPILSPKILYEIRINETTEKDLLALLGKPDEITSDSKFDHLFIYKKLSCRNGEMLAGNILLFPLMVFAGPPQSEYYCDVEKALSVWFDEDDIVKAFTYINDNERVDAYLDENGEIKIVASEGIPSVYSQNKINNSFLRYLNEE